jgi:hypothetical protein
MPQMSYIGAEEGGGQLIVESTKKESYTLFNY